MKEMENWKVHKTFQQIVNEGQSTISVRWIVTKKNKTKINIFKATLVARGFEEMEKDNIRKDSPTCCKEKFRIVLSIIVSFERNIHSLDDIESAFLQRQSIKRNVFLKPPPEGDTINLWKLLVTVYGLCDAPRAWYLKVKEVLEKAGARKSKFDDAIFYWYHNDKLEGILSCQDFVWGGTNKFIKKIINRHLGSALKNVTFKYLGLYLQQKHGEITIHQVPYINELKEF